MALSGSITTDFGPGSHYSLYIKWSATQDVKNNQSTVKATMYMYSDPTYSMYASASKTGHIIIGGTSYTITDTISTGGGAEVQLGSTQTKIIDHNDDGTGSFSLDGDFAFNVTIYTGGTSTPVNTVSLTAQTFTLNTIPRADTVTSSVSWTAGTQNLKVTIASNSADFHHTLQVFVGDTSSPVSYGSYVAQRTGVGTAPYTITFTQAEITAIYTRINGYENRPVILRCYTYDSDGTQIGSYQDKTGTVYAISTAYATVDGDNVFNIGSPISVVINNLTVSNLSPNMFQYDIIFTLGTGSTAFTKTFPNIQSTPYSMTFTPTELTSMYATTPNSNSVTGTVVVRTKYNGVYTEDGIPASHTANITANVTGSNPTFVSTGLSYADTNGAVTAITQDPTYIVQNKSTVTVTIPVANRAISNNSSTMSYYIASLGGASQRGNWSGTADVTIALGVINLSANSTLTITAYDSRGNSTPVTLTAKILPYSAPVVNTSSARNNGFDPDTTISLNSGSSYSPLTIGGAPKNTLKAVTYAYKKSTDSSYPTATSFTYTTSNGAISVATPPVVTLDSGLVWNTQVVVQDALGSTTTQNNTVPAGTPILFMDATKKSVGVNQFPANSGTFEVTGDFYLNSKKYVTELSAAIPAVAGWYRIAQTASSIGNNMGTFEVLAAQSSHHSYTQIQAGINYGDDDCNLNVVAHSTYGSSSNSAIIYSRIVYNNTYSGNFAYLEVYTPNTATYTMTVRLIGGSGWSLVSPDTAGSVPTGYVVKTISLFAGGGILTTQWDFPSDINSLQGTFGVARSGNTSTNRPVDYTTVLNIPSSANSDFQFASAYSNINKLFFRSRHDTDGAWLGWDEVITEAETNSNANGIYWRFSNGMQICYLSQENVATNSFTWSSQTVGSSGWAYWYTSGYTWDYPATFLANTVPATFVSADIPFVGNESHNTWHNASQNVRCNYEHGIITGSSPATQAGATVLKRRFLAIGKWK
jgi:hypothetical protein